MLEVLQNADVEEIKNENLYEYEIDESTGRLTGRLIYDYERVKQWIRLCLQVQRYRYRCFSAYYGSEIEDEIIGKGYGNGLIESEVQRLICEALCCHPDIESVDNFSFNFAGSSLSVCFTVGCAFGEISMEENIYV